MTQSESMTKERELMTTRFKDFGVGSSQATLDPLSFRLHGQDFECYPALQGKVLLDMVSMAGSEDASDMAGGVMEFFKKTLKPESYTRFEALTQDPETIVTVETLGEITAWMVAEYSESLS